MPVITEEDFLRAIEAIECQTAGLEDGLVGDDSDEE
jgi:hypothetical protein